MVLSKSNRFLSFGFYALLSFTLSAFINKPIFMLFLKKKENPLVCPYFIFWDKICMFLLDNIII